MSQVLFFIGLTASGKTEASLALANMARQSGIAIEIVNADARQLYRGMSIGTAKPTTEEQNIAPHHMLDVVKPDQPYSLGVYLKDARVAIQEILGRGGVPLVVGGSGQYVLALIEGWTPPKVEPNPSLRNALEMVAKHDGAQALHHRLLHVDPVSAAKISPSNVRRVIRALEVWEHSGQTFSNQSQRVRPTFTPLVVGIQRTRHEIHRRISNRVDRMLTMGFGEEVRGLLEQGYDPTLTSFSSAGYREMVSYLAGDLTIETAKERTIVATNRLARSQGAWFRKIEHCNWSHSVGDLVTSTMSSIQRSGVDEIR